nr:8-amino-7-oxononanoate synthase [Ferrimonas senticii]
MPSGWQQRLQQIVTDRQANGLLRQRTVIEPHNGRELSLAGQRLLQFASNDYLGLAFANEPLAPMGAGASALVSGYHQAHQQLEQQLCQLLGFEAALLFSSGFAANSAPLALLQAGDRLLADKLIHASVVDAAQASAATLRRFPHNNMKVLGRWLGSAPVDGVTMVATESLFSMDGDQAPLADLVALCRQHGALSWIDDAHGFGILGAQGLGASEIAKPDLLTVTFGKALGASGAALLGSKAVIDAILQSSRHYTYSTAMPADLAQRISLRLQTIQTCDKRQHLKQLIAEFRRQAAVHNLPLLPSSSPIQPLLCQNAEHASALALQLRREGLFVAAIRPPTVPQARVRVVLNACHRLDDISRLVVALATHYHCGEGADE